MFLKNFHIFINKRALPQQRFPVQVTTLPDCDDITRFDGIPLRQNRGFSGPFVRRFRASSFSRISVHILDRLLRSFHIIPNF